MTANLSSCVKLNVETTKSGKSFSSTTFSTKITIEQLKERLEMMTGCSHDSMKLSLFEKERKVAELNDDGQLLGDFLIKDEMILKIDGAESILENDEEVEKYEMDDKEYDKLKGTVRDFKRKRQMGRFAPDAEQKKIEADNFGKDEAEKIKVGNRCEVKVSGVPPRRGCVKFVGKTKFQLGYWVGIQYDEPYGKNNGSHDGEVYFVCPNNYGGFIRPHCVQVGDFPELGYDDSDDEF